MKFTLGQIRKHANNEPYTFDDYVDVSELKTMNNDIRDIKPVQVSGHCTFRGNQIVFSFQIKGEMILPCARTLVDVPYPFQIKANEVFTTSSYFDEEEEDEIHPIDGEVIDLTPYIKENILLEKPYRVFSEEAKEQGPEDGEGWKFLSEEEEKSKVDPRLQKLESLLDKKKKDN
ncbi:hypothetical protein D8M04_10215 [Oceanobacillus piezotolerans]|uniref:DUF177 domain-containing protein n=1 Tax=Oceanobacillus piezotolerans TaxID=2448030 RepID=A0A498DE25_9BACI|nr:YceD family protein [Oceanobacillus piezotolerans]RLL45224.1 hypothetical protein D8M04_10215 [Oceanobacillus piezotolerans]